MDLYWSRIAKILINLADWKTRMPDEQLKIILLLRYEKTYGVQINNNLDSKLNYLERLLEPPNF
jgi:hypothetical protein